MRPLILVSCNTHRPDDGPVLSVTNDNYTRAVWEVCEGIPLLIPAMGTLENVADELVDRADGILLTGSATMVHPERYGRAPATGVPLNVERDAVSFALIHSALEQRKPLLGICRGLQELNVALGGSLRASPGHRAPVVNHWEEKYRPSHSIRLLPGGRLSAAAAVGAMNAGVAQDRIMVNSLHAEAIAELGKTLRVEALAEDNTIEAVSVADPDVFAVGVQWHAEAPNEENALSRGLLLAFGEACRVSMRAKEKQVRASSSDRVAEQTTREMRLCALGAKR